MTGTLASRLRTACINAFDSGEHMQIAGLIKQARIHVVEDAVAWSAQNAVTEHLWSVERNLDLISLPDNPVWFEWPLPTRNGRSCSGRGNERTGCLIARHPLDSQLHMIISAWELDQGPMHAYGIALIAESDLINLARQSKGLARSHEESMTRIMSMIATFVPTAFQEEMRILSGGLDQTESAMRDATADIPYLLTLLLLCRAAGGAIFKMDENGVVLTSMGERYKPDTLAKIRSRITRSPKSGFVRVRRHSAAWMPA